MITETAKDRAALFGTYIVTGFAYLSTSFNQGNKSSGLFASLKQSWDSRSFTTAIQAQVFAPKIQTENGELFSLPSSMTGIEVLRTLPTRKDTRFNFNDMVMKVGYNSDSVDGTRHITVTVPNNIVGLMHSSFALGHIKQQIEEKQKNIPIPIASSLAFAQS